MTEAKVQQTGPELHGAPVTEAITRFAIRTPGDAIPDSARQVARLSLFDWVAVGPVSSKHYDVLLQRFLACR